LGEKKTLLGLSKGQTKRKESRKKNFSVFFLVGGVVNSIHFANFFGKVSPILTSQNWKEEKNNTNELGQNKKEVVKRKEWGEVCFF
jgi:hypothetical protein